MPEPKPQKPKKSKILSFRYLLHDFVKLTAAIPGLLFFRPKKIYENERARKKIRGGALLISNHSSFFDPIYLMLGIWYRRHHFVAFKELFDHPLRAFLFRGCLCIPIDREHFGMSTFREITETMAGGGLVSIFPEGQVNKDGTANLQQFKSGAVMMALKAGAPIVPAYVYKKKKFLSRVRVAVGEPIDIAALYGKTPNFRQIEELTKRLQEQEEKLKTLAKGEGSC